jgi:hypothetical protein
MRARDKDLNIDYTLFWLEHGGTAIREKPNGQGGVHHWTHANYSGGLTGWEDSINQVYFKPSSIEERLLQSKVHEIMLEALKWALQQAESQTPFGPWTVWGGMDLAEAYRLSHMVTLVDPMLACSLKIRLNKISKRTGKNLAELADVNFMAFIGPSSRIQW